MTEPVRAAAVGIGWWSGVLADAIPKGTNIKLVTCTTRSSEKRAAFAEKYGCRQAESYEALLKDPEVEAVLLTTPHTLHGDQVVAAAEAGKHVFVEKPFTLTVADGRRATEACLRAGVVLAVGHGRRRQPANRALKAMIKDGALGRVIQIEGNISSSTGFTLKPGGWRTDPRETPAGAMSGLGIHHVDTFQYLLGPITRVVALSRRQVLAGMAIDDTTGILLEFASGILGYLGTAFVLANRTNLFALHGTEAQAFSEAEGSRLFLQKKGEPARSPSRSDRWTSSRRNWASSRGASERAGDPRWVARRAPPTWLFLRRSSSRRRPAARCSWGVTKDSVDGSHDEQRAVLGECLATMGDFKSEIRDGMRIDWDVPIAMDDGLVLRADVYRPSGSEKYPVLLSYGPYGKWLHFEDLYTDQWRRMIEQHPDVPPGSTNTYQNWKVVDPEKWVPDGHICVRIARPAAHRPAQGIGHGARGARLREYRR